MPHPTHPANRRRRVGPAARAAGPIVVAATAVCACCFVWAADPTTPGGISPPCPTKALLNVTCPGCGAARMLYSLLHGRVGDALHYNALGVVALVVLAWSLVAWAARAWGLARLPRWDQWRWSPHVVLVLVGVWFVIRNLPFAPFSALHV